MEKDKWGSQAEGIGVTATQKKKKEKLRKKGATLRIEEPIERPKKSHRTESSKSLAATVEYSSSDDDNVVIAPLLKRLRSLQAVPV
ncbi:hypothetical protein Nepgr_019522 [Nepenthes gracilis]|uniref:Uncharacterized protein n=1 Tax=Nepenthes gracilis TaxID=150966 RepID=A0AAD3SVG6_NEPGR|nr:hypothetical protein Nepgr_019522 [Nepenthes gracilis]